MTRDYRFYLSLPAGTVLAVGSSTFRLPGAVEMLAAPRGDNWVVPFNNGLAVVPGTVAPASVVRRRGGAIAGEDAVNDYNTSLVTCHDCGAWLGGAADGYGTAHGWCGCNVEEEE